MKSANFSVLSETHPRYPHNLVWKIRRALVEGIGPAYDIDRNEVGRYGRLIVEHTHYTYRKRIRILYNFFRKPEMREENQEFLNDLLREMNPNGSKWANEDGRQLKAEMVKEGVVVESAASDIAGLVRELVDLPDNKVLYSSLPVLQEGVDYEKRIDVQRRIKLNGAAVIRDFARRKGFQVPENGFGGSKISNELYSLLQQYGYDFSEGLRSGCNIAQARPNMDLTAFVVMRPDGNPTLIFPKDLVEGSELSYELSRYRPGQIHMEQGVVQKGEFKYFGENTIFIPSRRSASQEHRVIVKYLPNLDRKRDMFLEWFNTEMICSCEYASQFRNKEERTGHQMVRYSRVCDAHARAALLWVSEEYGNPDSEQIVYPTPFAVALIDKMRYNWHSTRGMGERVINRVFCEAIKLFGFDMMFQNYPIDESAVLMPLYTALETRSTQ